MDDQLAVAIFVVLVVFVVIFAFTYHFFSLTGWAAFTLGLIVAYFVMVRLYPPNNLSYQNSSGIIMIYLFILTIVPIYVLIYLLLILFQTKRETKPIQLKTSDFNLSKYKPW